LFICKKLVIYLIFRDNTCEICLTDIVERKDVKPDQFEKGNYKESDSIAGKYATKLRK